MAVVTMKQLLEAGVHFGHQTRRWNPKMKRFIFGERNGIYIIDLKQTLERTATAYEFVRDLVAGGGTILFIGTKKQTQDPVATSAMACGMPYINERWLGGMLTNYTTILTRVQKLRELDRMQQAGDFEAMPKKEALMKSRELEKLQRNLGGIKGMSRQPDAVFINDTKKEHIAVTEANKLNIPIVAVVDTNCDPDLIQYVIPGNDDAIRAGNLLCRVIADAVDEGRYIAAKKAGHAAAAAAAARTAEDEARIATEQAEARQQAAAEQADREARLAAASASLNADDPPAEGAPAEAAAAEPAPQGAPAQDAPAEGATDAAPVDPTPADVAAGEPDADDAAPAAPADA